MSSQRFCRISVKALLSRSVIDSVAELAFLPHILLPMPSSTHSSEMVCVTLVHFYYIKDGLAFQIGTDCITYFESFAKSVCTEQLQNGLYEICKVCSRLGLGVADKVRDGGRTDL